MKPEPPPSGVAFWAGAVAGTALIAVGVYGMASTQELNRIVNWAMYAGGAIALHDALLAPFAIAVGMVLARRAPVLARPVLQSALIVSASVALATAPVWLERGRGRYPDNTTILPDASYPANLALVLGAVWLVASAAIAVRVARARRDQD
jgi:hypothetical protein